MGCHGIYIIPLKRYKRVCWMHYYNIREETAEEKGKRYRMATKQP